MDIHSFLIFYKSNESNHILHKSFFSPLRIHFTHFMARVHKIFEVKIRTHILNNNNNNNNNINRRYRNITWNNSRRLFITIAIVHLFNPLHRAADHVNTGYEEHTTRTRGSHFFFMVYVKLTVKTEE